MNLYNLTTKSFLLRAALAITGALPGKRPEGTDLHKQQLEF
jgi:hypothetical protein